MVLNRNGSAVLNPLLQSWSRYNTVPCDWIVVDHGSTDGSLAVLADWQKALNIEVVALDHNDSFSASSNRAVAMAHTPYVLFLNNDIVWLQDALGPMLQTLQDDPTSGAVGLKLLKATPGPQGFTTVQHLGVRYCQSGDSYWPYEATPDHHEAEFAPQAVPAVTAAAMLCRRADLNAVGGFDEHYFYGFEDVDLCLRLQHRLGKHIVCRNDLVALHRHGHTRLTGREGSQQFDRIANNARVLGQHSGLWAKQSWWHSLLSGDRLLCAEPLKIGLLATGRAAAVSPSTLRLGQRLQTQLPHAQVLQVQPGANDANGADDVKAFDVRGIHVLLVDTPTYDIRTLLNARPDLMLVALVNSRPHTWVAQPWWLSFSAYLCNTARSAQALQARSPVRIHTTTATQPVGQCLQPETLPLRVGIDWPAGFKDAAHLASQLQISFKQSGLACWLLPQDPGPAGRRVLDARVMLWPHATPAKAPAPAEATINVLWSPSAGKTKATTKASPQQAAGLRTATAGCTPTRPPRPPCYSNTGKRRLSILFLHPNVPGQFKRLASALARETRTSVVSLGDRTWMNAADEAMPGVTHAAYDAPAESHEGTHPWAAGFDAAVRRGQQVIETLVKHKRAGLEPDTIIAHPGWGDAFFVRDFFPGARVLGLFEYYYRPRGADVGFDPEFPLRPGRHLPPARQQRHAVVVAGIM